MLFPRRFDLRRCPPPAVGAGSAGGVVEGDAEERHNVGEQLELKRIDRSDRRDQGDRSDQGVEEIIVIGGGNDPRSPR